MNPNGPRRFLDRRAATPRLLRDALAGARARGPSAAALAELRASLPLGNGPGGPGGSGPGGGPAATPPKVPLAATPISAAVAPPSMLGGIFVGAALGVAVSGVWILPSWSSPAAPPRIDVVAQPLAPAASLSEAPTFAGASSLRASTSPSPASSPPPLPAPPPTPLSTPPAVAALPAHPTSREAPSTVPSLRADTASAFGPGPEDESEVRLLERAQELLATNPEQAQRLAGLHATRFPSGALTQEREVVAIQSLMRLGRVDEARARAARFATEFPDSAHRPSIEAFVHP